MENCLVPTETLTGYDNPINRQFAFGPLRSVGLSEPSDGTLHFATDRDDRQPGLYSDPQASFMQRAI
jgi:hypothetical protein